MEIASKQRIREVIMQSRVAQERARREREFVLSVDWRTHAREAKRSE